MSRLSRSIFFASAAHQEVIAQELITKLRSLGFVVWDRPEEQDQLDVFDYTTSCCAHVDLIVCLDLQSLDAAMQVGIAFTSGVPVYAVSENNNFPSCFINKAVSKKFDTINELLLDLTKNPDWGIL